MLIVTAKIWGLVMVVIHKKLKETPEEKEAREKKAAEQSAGIQDEYQAKGFELVSWVQHNKGLVSGLIVGIVIGSATFAGYKYYAKRSSEIASEAYIDAVSNIGDAKDDEGKKKLAEAHSALASVASGQKDAKVSTLANLYAGHLALENNDAKMAVQHYEKALSDLKEADAFYGLALLGLGYALEKEGRGSDALTYFDKIVTLKLSSFVEIALWESARLSQALDKKESALGYVKKLLEDFPASVYESGAKRLEAKLR